MCQGVTYSREGLGEVGSGNFTCGSVKEETTEQYLSKALREVREKLQGCLGKSVPGRGKSICKGPEVGWCLVPVKGLEGKSGWSRVRTGRGVTEGLWGACIRTQSPHIFISP